MPSSAGAARAVERPGVLRRSDEPPSNLERYLARRLIVDLLQECLEGRSRQVAALTFIDGLTTKEIAERYKKEAEEKAKRDKMIADAWALGVFEKDQDKVKAARDALAQWNADNPESPIRIDFKQIAKQVRAMNEDKATRIAKTAPVEIRAAVRRELESAR